MHIYNYGHAAITNIHIYIYLIHKQIFCRCCVATFSVMQSLASMLKTDVEFIARQDAIMIKVNNFQVILLNKGYNLKLVVRLHDKDILPETVWILINDLSTVTVTVS